MNVLVVIFGGLDHSFMEKWDCKNLRQAEWGKVTVDELCNGRDVATQITGQLITGETWKKNGINGRKKVTVTYPSAIPRWIEKTFFKDKALGVRRKALYELLGWRPKIKEVEFLKDDLTCPCLFDVVENSRAVYVPAYNPEPSWALGRNILNPKNYPELGEQGALDLLEMKYDWRHKNFMEALESEETFPLLVGQFQYIDSTQHLYCAYSDPPNMEKVEEAYWKIDKFAGEILALAKGRYDKTLFISDNGAAIKGGFQPTHHNRPCYSISEPEGLTETNLRDFYGHITRWVSEDPNPGVIK